MREPFVFAACIEALFRGGEPALVSAGAVLAARFMKALIVAHELEPGGERVFLVRNG